MQLLNNNNKKKKNALSKKNLTKLLCTFAMYIICMAQCNKVHWFIFVYLEENTIFVK